ncbi:hypothetical protein EMA8858_01501 [Emticicia aquatica]|uniref:Type 9 secretion system plug protein N-terminal domain-containing protein n=1 Tax=Emticicia aquatica TaxID=1681835 RepID=A0ABN8ER60_9BACT|nr:type IX secretion system plug protein domain-containing protein [Emticicia aquatica]CAH0995380.1 hypothetical protein EMA8858_01501 [Emticicia aquatica]
MRNLFTLLFLFIHTLLFGQDKQLKFEDFTYESNIKTVLLYPLLGAANDAARTLNPPILSLQDTKNLWLEFDDLNANYEQFHVRILHCTYDWKQSVLSEIEYMPEYNDLIINDYRVSRNTKIPYYHYKIEIPKVLLSGNYLLVVWRGRRKDDIVLSKRFMVYESQVGAFGTVKQAQAPSKFRSHQQVDFEINYGGYRMMSPRDELKIVVRQNYRWEKTAKNLRAFSVNESTSKLEFRFFDDENTFPAGNEFLFFDSRSTYNKGQYIAQIRRGKEDEMWVSPQSNRSETAYIEANDFDGSFVIDNRESTDGEVEADYIYTTFGLKTHELEGANEKVYVNGGFNNWRLDKINEMIYDNNFGGYTASILLKQGVYNYIFIIQKPNSTTDEAYFEGNFGETQNTYEIFIYHRPVTARAEKLVGYHVVDFNKKR